LDGATSTRSCSPGTGVYIYDASGSGCPTSTSSYFDCPTNLVSYTSPTIYVNFPTHIISTTCGTSRYLHRSTRSVVSTSAGIDVHLGPRASRNTIPCSDSHITSSVVTTFGIIRFNSDSPRLSRSSRRGALNGDTP